MTVTLNIPDSFIGDWTPAWEDYTVVREPDYPDAHPRDRGYADNGEADIIREALDALDAAPHRKVGKGGASVVTMSPDAWWWIRRELVYRWEFNGGNGSPYGVEDPDYSVRYACARAIKRVDAALADTPPEADCLRCRCSGADRGWHERHACVRRGQP